MVRSQWVVTKKRPETEQSGNGSNKGSRAKHKETEEEKKLVGKTGKKREDTEIARRARILRDVCRCVVGEEHYAEFFL